MLTAEGLAQLLETDLFTIDRAAEYLGIAPDSVEAAGARGRLPFVQLARKKLFIREELDDYLAKVGRQPRPLTPLVRMTVHSSGGSEEDVASDEDGKASGPAVRPVRPQGATTPDARQRRRGRPPGSKNKLKLLRAIPSDLEVEAPGALVPPEAQQPPLSDRTVGTANNQPTPRPEAIDAPPKSDDLLPPPPRPLRVVKYTDLTQSQRDLVDAVLALNEANRLSRERRNR